MPNYTFGSYVLNSASGGLGNWLLAKNLDMPVIKPQTHVVARRDGTKKSGEIVDPRTINVSLKIIGSSRTDLISRLDALQQALALRGQQLCIHEDGRYFQNVDAVSATAKFAAGTGIVQATVDIAFIAYDPYAYASTSSSYDTGTVALTLSSSVWNFSTLNITGGGTIYAYPLIRLYNRTSTGQTTLTAARNSGTAYTTIAVAATSFSGSVGDIISITHSTTTQNLTVATAFSVGATTITVNSFTASANYVSGDVAKKVTDWTSISISQSNDSQTLSTVSTSSVPLPSANGDYIDFQCDPGPANGWTIITNNSGKYSDPVGVFPIIEPSSTSFSIAIASSSAVSAQAVFSWLARYLS